MNFLALQFLFLDLVVCDLYFPVFVAYAGNGQSVYNAWVGPSMSNDIPTLIGQNQGQNHLRNHFIDHWTDVKQVKLELFENNERVAWVKFDGNGTDKMDWFSKERLFDSSFNDLAPCSNSNYFSIQGSGRRKFFICRSYGGCPKDNGWLAIIDNENGCPWEMRGPRPTFIYTKNHTPRDFLTDYLTADTMVISVLLDL